MPKNASQEQQRYYAYQMGLRAWKEQQLEKFDSFDRVILQLADGDPEKLRRYRYEITHTEIAEAYLSTLINGGT